VIALREEVRNEAEDNGCADKFAEAQEDGDGAGDDHLEMFEWGKVRWIVKL